MVSTISSAICRFAGRHSLLVALGLLLLVGCDQDEDLAYSNIPEITLLEVSLDTVRQYEDVLYIRIGYRDGDGDLGFLDPESYALFVRDIRLAAFDGFYIGPLAPPDVRVPIQGELTIELPSLFLFGSGDMEITRFQIRMIDRAGQESNLLETDLIAILRP